MNEREQLHQSDIPGMKPVSLEQLQDAGLARIVEDHDGKKEIEFTISPKWPYKDETRIGEASIGRLFECIREHHWREDVISVAGMDVDCATRSSKAEYHNPVSAGEKVRGRYKVLDVGQTSYSLELTLKSTEGVLLSRAVKKFVFIDPEGMKATIPPAAVKNNLERLRDRDMKQNKK